MTSIRFIPVLFSLALACLSLTTPASAAIDYVYDDAGRLIGVIDPSGDTAIYSYDAVGNLLSISRQSSAIVSIINFTPKSGPVGTVVTIQGTGFSATPSQNTVTFNGTTAPVTSASATELLVTVPVGATTGPIAVTAPAGSATSSTPFTVTATSGAPTITGFTPNIGVPGETTTINGTNFDLAPPSNKVMFNITRPTRGPATTATATAVGVTVPTGATSGRVSVATSGGKTDSTADFFVPPPGNTSAQVVGTGRLSIGGASQAFTIPVAKISMAVFDGTVGQQVSVGMAPFNNQPSVTVYRPDGVQLASFGGAGPLGAVLHLPPLPAAGTYAMVASGYYAGNVTLTLSQEVTGTIAVGGAATPISITRAGQRARLTFSGVAGQRLNVGLTSSTFSPTNVTVSVLRPDGTTLASGTSNGVFAVDTPALATTGTYALLVEPHASATGSITVTLSEELAGTITVGGPSVAVTITRAGQRARLTFAGTAGQQLDLGAGSITFPTFNPAQVTMYRPDGTVLGGPVSLYPPGVTIDPSPLTTTGTYEIVVNPALADTGSVTLTLSEEVTGAITIGGASVPVSIARAGQRARITFAGTAGQRVGLGMTGVTITSATVSMLKPDGTSLASVGIGASPASLHSPVLPVTGTYTILIDPGNVYTGNVTLTLSEEVTSTIVIDGASVPVSITRAGQRARLTFTGSTGQQLGLAFTASTVSGATSLVNPAGTTVVSGGVSASGGWLDSGALPSSGTYAVVVEPYSAGTGNVTVTVSAEIIGTLTVGGASLPLNISRHAQRARLSFSGTAGQVLSVGMTSNTITSTAVSVLKPDGTYHVLPTNFGLTSNDLDIPALPVTGTYALLVDPLNLYTGNVTLTLSEEITGSITMGGAAVPVSIGRPGQLARLTFSGTAGQRVSVSLTGVTMSGWVAIYNPNGTALGAGANLSSGSTAFLDTRALTATGSHTILIDPSPGQTGAVTVTLHSVPADVTGSLTVNGATVPVTLTTPGQNALLTFSGTAGQAITVRVVNNTIPNCTTVWLLQPGGASQGSMGLCSVSSGNLVRTLTVTGTHTVKVDPNAGDIGSLDVSVTSP